MTPTAAEELILAGLNEAVPRHVAEMKRQRLPHLLARAPDIARYIALYGDKLMFKCKPGEITHAFNLLAEGIAIASFAKGGVTFMGEHWENDHPDAVAKCRRCGGDLARTDIEGCTSTSCVIRPTEAP